MKISVVNIIFLFHVFCILSISAEEYEVRDAVVLVLIQSGNFEEDQYRQIIEDTVKIEMESAKLQVITDSIMVDISELDKASALAEKENADFIITGVYEIRNKLLEVEFLWFDAQFNRVSEPVFDRIVMDLAFDEKISETVNEIIYLMQERIKEFPLVVIEKPEITEDAEPSEVIEENPEESYKVNIQKTELEAFILSDTVTVQKKNYLEIAGGFAPFICMGRANDYFKVGYIPEAYINYVFGFDFGKIGVGLLTGINLFNIEEFSENSSFLVPICASVMYKTPFKGRLNFVGRVSSGPAVFSVHDGNERLSKIIFSLLSSAGLDIRINEMLGLVIDAGYYIFFEEDDPVMGFAPGLYCSFRI